MKPHIGIYYVNTIPSEEFEEFKRVVSASGEDVQIIPRDPPGLMAGAEWLMSTIVFGFVASAYFGGFFRKWVKITI